MPILSPLAEYEPPLLVLNEYLCHLVNKLKGLASGTIW